MIIFPCRAMLFTGWLVRCMQPAERALPRLWARASWRETACLWPESSGPPSWGEWTEYSAFSSSVTRGEIVWYGVHVVYRFGFLKAMKCFDPYYWDTEYKKFRRVACFLKLTLTGGFNTTKLLGSPTPGLNKYKIYFGATEQRDNPFRCLLIS